MSITPEQALALRKPFPKESVGKLPKGGAMLDYVGHAAVTDRLLTVDPGWSWEPFALDDHGLPALDRAGNLWIRLTICGTTRIGVGDGKSAKECIGDAIRNAAMRFGVALDLWAKEDLVEFANAAASRQAPAPAPPPAADPETLLTATLDGEVLISTDQTTQLAALMADLGLDKKTMLATVREITGRTVKSAADLTEVEADLVIANLAARTPEAEAVES